MTFTVTRAAYKEVLKKYSKAKHKDFTEHYLYILNVICWISLNDSRFTRESYVSVKFDYIRNIISFRKIKSMFNDLLEWGIIETDRHYITGVKSVGYRIAPKFFDKMISVTVKDKKIISKLDKLREKDEESNVIDYGDMWISLNEVLIDKKRAVKYLRNKYELNSDKYARGLYSIGMIDNKKFFMTKDKSGRIHTNLTNLLSDLRQFLYLESGEVLGEADITNSQPLFLYTALTKADTINPKELKKYGELVTSGKFYEFFIRDEKTTRKDVKNKVIMFFFDRNRMDSKIGEVFAAEFPTIYDYIWTQKEQDYKSFAHLLQSEESKFIIGQCVPAIQKLNRFEFVSTIHDSLIIAESDVELAKQVLTDKFEELYGIRMDKLCKK